MTRIVSGFRFGGSTCGIKESGRPDLALLVADEDVPAAAVFTRNRVKAAPVLLSQKRIRSGVARAVLVNSGNANACTGEAGDEAARTMTRAIAEGLGAEKKRILVASTGIIGVPLPVEKIVAGREALLAATSVEGFEDFSRAILTTDNGPKTAEAEAVIGKTVVRLLGCTKGAGMIAPNMATTLAFVATDADVHPRWLKAALAAGVNRSFNDISVDGDTSTNDSCFVFASGRAGNRRVDGGKAGEALGEALRGLLENLAIQIVRDGEGATRVVHIEVRGARDGRSAARIARRVGTSPLVKTALFGAEPNWGRVLCAVGNAGVDFDPSRVDILVGEVPLVKGGLAVDGAEAAAHAVMQRAEYPIEIHLHRGKASGRLITCDLTDGYVKINADYKT